MPTGVETRRGAQPDGGARAIGTDELRMELARAVATRRIPDEAIAAVAKRLSASRIPIRGIDICTYGICIDYFFNDDRWVKVLPEIVRVEAGRVHSITVFPWGIPVPDLFRVRVEQEFDEFARFGAVR